MSAGSADTPFDAECRPTATDGVARILFAVWEAYGAAHGATGLLWGFFAVEVVFGVLQLAPWLPVHPTRLFTARLRRNSRGSMP